MTLTAQEFLRRFLPHVLPRGFVRIRFYGFLANRRRANLLPLCQQLLLHHPSVCEKELRQNACAQFVQWRRFRNRDREVFKLAEAPNHNL